MKESLDKQVEQAREHLMNQLKKAPIKFESPEYSNEDWEIHMDEIAGKEAVTVFQFDRNPSITVLHQVGWTTHQFKTEMNEYMHIMAAIKIRNDDTWTIMTESTETLTANFMEQLSLDEISAKLRLFNWLEDTKISQYQTEEFHYDRKTFD